MLRARNSVPRELYKNIYFVVARGSVARAGLRRGIDCILESFCS